jgi:hypothetical protein
MKSIVKATALSILLSVVVSCGPKKDNLNSEQGKTEFPTAPAMDQPILVNPNPTDIRPSAIGSPGGATDSTSPKPSSFEDHPAFNFQASRVGGLERDINPLTVYIPANDMGGFDTRIKEGMSETFQVYYKYQSGLTSRSIMERSVTRFDETFPALTKDSAQVVTKIQSALDNTMLVGFTEQQFKCNQVVKNSALKGVNCQKVREFIHEEEERRKQSRQLGVTAESYRTCWIRNYKNEDPKLAQQHELLEVKQIERDTGVYVLQSGQKIEKTERKITQEVGEVVCGDTTDFQFIGRGIKTTEEIVTYEHPTLEFLDRSIAKEIARVEEIQLEESKGNYKLIQQSRIELVQMSQNATK